MVKPPRPMPQPIRREDSQPPSASEHDSGDQHIAQGEEGLHAAFAGQEAAGQAAAARVSVQALSQRMAESDRLNRERIDRLDSKLERKIDRLAAETRKETAVISGDVATIKADQIRILLALSTIDTDRADLRRRLAVAEKKAAKAEQEAEEASEAVDALEVTGQSHIAELQRRASRGEEFLEDAARRGLAIAEERQRTEIALKAEARRAFVKTVSTIALAAFGGGGVVWVLLSKGCA